MSNKAAGVFKKSFIGGFNKSDVLEYFDKLSFQSEQDKQELNARIELLEKENSRLNGEVQECSSRLADEQERAGASVSYANGLRTELSRQQFITEEKNNELQLQKSLCDQMQVKLAEYEEKMAKLESRTNESEMKLSVLAAARDKRIAELEAAKEEAEKRADEHQKNSERLIKEITALQEKYDKLEKSFDEASLRIKELKTELEHASFEREEAERIYNEKLSAASAAAKKLESDQNEQSEQLLSDVRERVGYVNNELSSFKDEIQELRRLTEESFNTAEKKLAGLENVLASSSRSIENTFSIADGKTAVPESGAAAKVKKIPESIKTAGSAARGVYQVAVQEQGGLLENVMDSLERLMRKWTK